MSSTYINSRKNNDTADKNKASSDTEGQEESSRVVHQGSKYRAYGQAKVKGSVAPCLKILISLTVTFMKKFRRKILYCRGNCKTHAPHGNDRAFPSSFAFIMEGFALSKPQ